MFKYTGTSKRTQTKMYDWKNAKLKKMAFPKMEPVFHWHLYVRAPVLRT